MLGFDRFFLGAPKVPSLGISQDGGGFLQIDHFLLLRRSHLRISTDLPGPLPSGNVTRYARFEGQTVKGATSPDRVYLSMSRERSFNLGRFTGNLTQGSKNLRSLAR